MSDKIEVLITKQEFVKIINRLKETDDIKNKINDLIRTSTDTRISDFTNASSLMICHEDIVVELLKKMFDDTEDSVIGYWLYECDYGRKYDEMGIYNYGKKLDLSTAEKLYDYLIEELESRYEQMER